MQLYIIFPCLFSFQQVVRSAEEAASMLATSISPDQCIKVLCPIIQTADYPINLAAIKMQTKVIERVSKETLTQLLPEIVPGLIQVKQTNKNPLHIKELQRYFFFKQYRLALMKDFYLFQLMATLTQNNSQWEQSLRLSTS